MPRRKGILHWVFPDEPAAPAPETPPAEPRWLVVLESVLVLLVLGVALGALVFAFTADL